MDSLRYLGMTCTLQNAPLTFALTERDTLTKSGQTAMMAMLNRVRLSYRITDQSINRASCLHLCHIIYTTVQNQW